MNKMMRSLMTACGFMLLVTGLAGVAAAVDVQVPELDPGSIGSALTVASGAILVLRGRRAGK